ncbi:hypothetical protein DFJ74DRAFT_709945 [Hyaloraphidium curvatum]|nr:hypothetical protein DFJ74DRAFT_709945 [Hyaloraphidium curvatum]
MSVQTVPSSHLPALGATSASAARPKPAISVRLAEKKNLSGFLGVEILDPRVKIPALSDDDIKELEQLLATRGVVVLRDQHITVEQQLEFGRRFGKLHVHHAAQFADFSPEVLVVHADGDNAQTAEGWHADVTFLEEPPKISILRMETTPPVGGNTNFVNVQTAYDKLSPPLKQLAKSLKAVHSGLHTFGYTATKQRLHDFGIPVPQSTKGVTGYGLNRVRFPLSVDIASTELDAPLPVEHPVVATHPITGRSYLYVNPTFTSHIAGVRKDESDKILKLLYDHIKETYEAQLSVAWGGPNTVVIFDHRVVWHSAHNDFFPHVRTGYRATVLGERPFFDPEAEKRAKPDSSPLWNRVLAGEEGVRRSLQSVGYTGKAKHTL